MLGKAPTGVGKIIGKARHIVSSVAAPFEKGGAVNVVGRKIANTLEKAAPIADAVSGYGASTGNPAIMAAGQALRESGSAAHYINNSVAGAAGTIKGSLNSAIGSVGKRARSVIRAGRGLVDDANKRTRQAFA